MARRPGRSAARVLLAAAACSALLLVASPSRADEPAGEASAPGPGATLLLAARDADATWGVRVTAGAGGARLVADPRLLSFEVTPPSGPSVTCALPAASRPTGDLDQGLALAEGQSWSRTVDPTFYCHGDKERAALVEGAKVVARFGFAEPKAKATKKAAAPSGPFAVAPRGDRPGVRALTSPEIALPAASAQAPAAPPPPPKPVGGDEAPRVRVTATRTLDVARVDGAQVTVTVENTGTRPAWVFLRPSVLGFNVTGPGVDTPCRPAPDLGSGIREHYTLLGVGKKVSTTLVLEALCSREIFATPGVYAVTATYDTRRTSPPAFPAPVFVDEAPPAAPTIVRVREGDRTAAPPPAPDP